jgi:hypothetical protein
MIPARSKKLGMRARPTRPIQDIGLANDEDGNPSGEPGRVSTLL